MGEKTRFTTIAKAIAEGGAPEVGPHGATFPDGYKAAMICDAIMESAVSMRQADISY